jgi:hypothetical protein
MSGVSVFIAHTAKERDYPGVWVKKRVAGGFVMGPLFDSEHFCATISKPGFDAVL